MNNRKLAAQGAVHTKIVASDRPLSRLDLWIGLLRHLADLVAFAWIVRQVCSTFDDLITNGHTSAWDVLSASAGFVLISAGLCLLAIAMSALAAVLRRPEDTSEVLKSTGAAIKDVVPLVGTALRRGKDETEMDHEDIEGDDEAMPHDITDGSGVPSSREAQ